MKSSINKIFIALLLSLPMTAAADVSHLNVDDKEMVHLRLSVGGPSVCIAVPDTYGPFIAVRSTGLLANGEFVVPAGKELVITDISWSGQTLNNRDWNGASSGVELEIYREDGTFNATAYRLPRVQQPASGQSIISSSVNLTAGAKIASRRILCARLVSLELSGGSTLGFNDRIRTMNIFGYLIGKSR